MRDKILRLIEDFEAKAHHHYGKRTRWHCWHWHRSDISQFLEDLKAAVEGDVHE